MDDRFVRDVSEQSVVTPAAYLLLYRRRADANGCPTRPPQSPESPQSPQSPPRSTAYSDPNEID